MAGTDRSKLTAIEDTDPMAPAILLVRPTLGENIGAAARAMLNFGLTDMRLVQPKGDWPNPKAINTASGAETVLERAQVFDTTEEAIADFSRVIATTARVREMEKPAWTPAESADRMRESAARGERTCLLFGREAKGLHNDDVALADAIMVIPTQPGFSSLNLAQAVLLMGYEWFQRGNAVEKAVPARKGANPATQNDIQGFFGHLEAELDACGFLYPPEKRPRMVRNIRNIFTRANLTDQEVNTLRGIVAGLVRGPHEKKDGG